MTTRPPETPLRNVRPARLISMPKLHPLNGSERAKEFKIKWVFVPIIPLALLACIVCGIFYADRNCQRNRHTQRQHCPAEVWRCIRSGGLHTRDQKQPRPIKNDWAKTLNWLEYRQRQLQQFRQKILKRLPHNSRLAANTFGGCGTASALPKCSIKTSSIALRFWLISATAPRFALCGVALNYSFPVTTAASQRSRRCSAIKFFVMALKCSYLCLRGAVNILDFCIYDFSASEIAVSIQHVRGSKASFSFDGDDWPQGNTLLVNSINIYRRTISRQRLTFLPEASILFMWLAMPGRYLSCKIRSGNLEFALQNLGQAVYCFF